MAPTDGGVGGDGVDGDHDSPFSMDIHAGAPRRGSPPPAGAGTRVAAEWAVGGGAGPFFTSAGGSPPPRPPLSAPALSPSASYVPPSPPPPEAVPITFRGVLSHLGPAFIVAVGFLDPGNLSTNVEAGSRFGYALLWVLVASNGLAILLQTLSARLGIASRTHLAEACRSEYPRGVNLGLWAAAEVAVIATDLTEVLGTAIGLNLLFRVPLLVGCVATFADTLLLLGVGGGEGGGPSGGGAGLRSVEVATFVLLGLLSSCFVAELFLEAPDWRAAAVGAVVPRLPRGGLLVSTAMVGATVMPHNVRTQREGGGGGACSAQCVLRTAGCHCRRPKTASCFTAATAGGSHALTRRLCRSDLVWCTYVVLFTPLLFHSCPPCAPSPSPLFSPHCSCTSNLPLSLSGSPSTRRARSSVRSSPMPSSTRPLPCVGRCSSTRRCYSWRSAFLTPELS